MTDLELMGLVFGIILLIFLIFILIAERKMRKNEESIQNNK